MSCYHCFQSDDVFSFYFSYVSLQIGCFYDHYLPYLCVDMFTFLLSAVSGIVTWFSTIVASLVSKLGFYLPSFASSRIILKLNFHFLTEESCIVEPTLFNFYSLTARAASYPYLYSIKANEY
jgi:hypothetical protein